MQRGTTYVNTLTPLRVLLIEDSPLIRERLFESLVDPGRIEIVGEADTEEAAVTLVNAAAWDVLVLDLQLKHGTGLGVLRSLFSHRVHVAKVIVLISVAFLHSTRSQGHTMKLLCALLLSASIALSLPFLGVCNTVQGAGKDVERGGEKIQREAQEHKNY